MHVQLDVMIAEAVLGKDGRVVACSYAAQHIATSLSFLSPCRTSKMVNRLFQANKRSNKDRIAEAAPIFLEER